MVDIRCWKCGAKSTGDTMDDARSIMDHAIGRSRGIKCGDNYNCIEEIKSESTPVESKPVESKPVTVPEQKVDDTPSEKIIPDKSTNDSSKPKSTKKFKKQY